MGLKMTLPKRMNGLYVDFVDAYWRIEFISYSTQEVGAELRCYPSRETTEHKGERITDNSFGFGSPFHSTVDGVLYAWAMLAPIAKVFPNGIPVDENRQKTSIYNWIKAYTGLPFEDVFED